MSKQRVFLVGATGETGKHVLDALVEDGSFVSIVRPLAEAQIALSLRTASESSLVSDPNLLQNLTCFIRTASEGKRSTQQIKERGTEIVTGELDGPAGTLVALLQHVDIVISCLPPVSLRDQIPLIDAAVKAGVKRFLPCNWGTPTARGILSLRDVKEDIHDHIFRQRLGFTIIDIGFWYQASIPRVPSGNFDSAIFMPANEVYAGGSTPNMLIDARDAGKITVKIIKDDRTLNKRVIAHGDVLSQNQIHKIIEDKTGEKIKLTVVNDDEARAVLKERKEAYEADPSEGVNRYLLAAAQYAVTKYIRADNTPENAKYLGYINANELFPEFRYKGYAEFVDELMAGKVEKPYPNVEVWRSKPAS